MDSIFNKFAYGQDENLGFIEMITQCIEDAVSEGIFFDSALDNFQFYPMEIQKEKSKDSILNLFLYRCLLQSVRIVALFHDVGHPPYSHIIETVLEQLYGECCDEENQWQKGKREYFKMAMDPYASDDIDLAFKCRTFYCDSSLVKSELHERIGLSLLQSSFNDVIPTLLEKITEHSIKYQCKIADILYHIIVVEFTTAILVEKDIVFKSFHKIVDGILDADRFDYIMRDSLNSGVDWGKIPYKRLINSTKLIYLEEIDEKKIDENKRPFVIAYPKKVTDDIVDLLLTRYKIFARINFHHRCMKTTVALQSCVLELAKDYLKSSGGCLCPEINILWLALTLRIGDRRNRIIRWNDSWLISVLHKALGKIMSDDNVGNDVLQENLEEILLNRKRYYSLIKRGVDCQRFIKRVFEYAGIAKADLIKLREHEYSKYCREKDEQKNISDKKILQLSVADAIDSINRIDEMLQVMENGDLELLNSLMPLQEMCINETIKAALAQDKNKGTIADFKTIVNYGRGKTGLPKHEDDLDEIYLYEGKHCTRFNEKTTLKPQIKAIEKTVPWIYVYFVPPRANVDIKELSTKVFDHMAEAVGERLRSRYDELFGMKKQSSGLGIK